MAEYQTEFRPELVASDVFIAPNATVLGDVTLNAQSSIWFGAVVRGDTDSIIVGARSNIQDLSVLHTDSGIKCRVGDRVTVGHAAIVHGCTIEDDVLIGMRAVVLNRAVIGAESIVAAGALVPEGMIIPPRSLVMGMPAKVVRPITPADLERIHYAAQHYVEASAAFRKAQAK
jgi:carbonic anhydrase/acetyltransferase-like protein (isoleucine patch superfamily)